MQSNLRGKTPVDVAATDVIARLFRGEDHVGHRTQKSASLSSDDSDDSGSPAMAAATSPSSVGGCMSPRLNPVSDSSACRCVAMFYSFFCCLSLSVLLELSSECIINPL